MTASIEKDQWQAIRTSTREIGDRFAEMVATAGDPQARGTGTWSIVDTAAHVMSIAWIDCMLLRPDTAPIPVPGLVEDLATTTVDDVNDLNDQTLRHITERDPKVLADMLRDRITTMLDSTEARDPAELLPWLGGARVSIAGLFAHMLNELLLHGYDVARATGASWTIQPRDAAYFFDLFMAGMAREGAGRLLDGGGPPRERPIAVEFRSDYTTPTTLVLHNGQVTAESPGRTPDVRVTFDPAAFNLMMFGRVGKLRTVLTRKVVIGGRRPWLLPVFLRTVRVPS